MENSSGLLADLIPQTPDDALLAVTIVYAIATIALGVIAYKQWASQKEVSKFQKRRRRGHKEIRRDSGGNHGHGNDDENQLHAQ